MTAPIADCINDALRPYGVAVVVEAVHLCMTTRGIEKHEVNMITRRFLGAFREDAALRREFLTMIFAARANALWESNAKDTPTMVLCLIRHRIFDLRPQSPATGEQNAAKTPAREDSFDLLRQMSRTAEPAGEAVSGPQQETSPKDR